MARILVVDDDKVVLFTIVDALQTAGHNISTAGNGKEGLKKFKRELFDLAILDVEMPSMNGLDLARHIKAIRPNFPIMVISGHQKIDRTDKFRRLKVEAFRRKPVDLKELIQLVEQLINDHKNP